MQFRQIDFSQRYEPSPGAGVNQPIGSPGASAYRHTSLEAGRRVARRAASRRSAGSFSSSVTWSTASRTSAVRAAQRLTPLVAA